MRLLDWILLFALGVSSAAIYFIGYIFYYIYQIFKTFVIVVIEVFRGDTKR
jgi:hypothetical protein